MAGVTMRHGRALNRNSKLRGRGENDEGVRLDFSKDPAENVREILTNIVKQQNVTKSKKLAFLNAFVKMLHRNQNKNVPLGFSYYNILCCLRVCVLHEAKEVRAATLRVMRYLINDECIDVLISLHIDYLIARSLDICLDNEIERVHAMRLIRKIMSVNPHKVPSSLIFPLVAIGNDGAYERDRMINVCLTTICELAMRSATQLAQCGGIATILHNIVDSYLYPRINECLVSALLLLLNHPHTRAFVYLNTDLEQLLAPFTDCHFRFSPQDSDVQALDEKENRYTASRTALVTIMRSWPGMIRLCRPDSRGVQSLLSTLYLPDSNIRKAVLDVVYEVFRLPVPTWTTSFSAALHSVDATIMKEDWKLMNGFVVSEGRALLSHLSNNRPNLVDNHVALLLSAWITAGLFEALVEVVTTGENELFVFGVILLGQLLHMAGHILPDEASYSCHCLPSLMALISAPDTPLVTRRKVSVVVQCLSRVHTLKKRGLSPCSLYLTQICRHYPRRSPLQPQARHHKHADPFNHHCSTKSMSEDAIIQAIRESNVSESDSFNSWNWDTISALLQWPHDILLQMQDQTVTRFIKRLVHFYRPSSQQYADVNESHDLSHLYTTTGCHLIEFLHSAEGTATKQLITLFEDISHVISEVTVARPVFEAQLGMNNVTSKLVAHYFILIGHMSALTNGQRVLQQCRIFQQLLELVSVTSHDVYMKLAIVCLDYSQVGMPTAILSKAINSGSESSRLFATKFLQVLLRARVPNFSTWGMEMLITQLYDTSRPVAMTALSVIEEACENEAHLFSIIKMRPSLLHLGDRGSMMVCRFMSVPSGFKFLSDANYVANELLRWYKTFNVKYVTIVEELLNEALMTYERTYDGSYTRRSNRKRPNKDVYAPIHLYGQLVQHKEGLALLKRQKYMSEYFESVRTQELNSVTDSVQLKTALWALGHLGTSMWGVSWLEEDGIIPVIIKLAEESAVFSIRGTAFYVLGLVASTRQGCTILAQFGWESVWHARTERWPLIDEHNVVNHDDEMHTSWGEVSRPGTPTIAGPLFFVGEKKTSSLCLQNETDDERTKFDDSMSKSVSEASESSSKGSPGTKLNNARIMDHASVGVPKGGCMDGSESPALTFTSHSHTASAISVEKCSSDAVSVSSDAVYVRSDAVSVRSACSDPGVKQTSHRKSIAERSSELRAKFLMEYPTSGQLHGSQPLLTSGHSKIVSRAIAAAGKKKRNISESDSPNISSDSVVTSIKLCNSESNVWRKDAKSLECSACETSPTVAPDCSRSHIPSPTTMLSKRNLSENVLIKIHEHNHVHSADTSLSTDTDDDLFLQDKDSSSKSHDQNDASNKDNPVTSATAIDQPTPDTNEHSIDNYSTSNPNRTKHTGIVRNRPNTISTLDKSNAGNNKSYTLSKFGRSISDYGEGVKPRSNSSTSGVDSSTSGPGGSYDSSRVIGHRSPLTLDIDSINSDKSPSLVHPSSVKRHKANLTRVPSLQRRTQAGTMSPPLDDALFLSSSFRSSRSEWGYVTLRSLKRQHTGGSERDSDLLSQRHTRAGSVGSDGSLTTCSLPLSPSFASIKDLDLSMTDSSCQGLHRLLLEKVHKASTGEAEFVGITLPVDVTMMFEVNEGEDKRTTSITIPPSTPTTRDAGQDVDISQNHDVDHCLACCREKVTPLEMCDVQISVTEAIVCEDNGEDLGPGGLDCSRLRAESNADTLSSSSGSHTDIISSQKMTEDSVVGRMVIRKEMMRFMMSLASSIGTRSAEQGLLYLKQKFPTFFRDMCVYSDISHLLATYSFRLNARRFIQELFDELNVQKLFKEPAAILNLDPGNNIKISSVTPIETDEFSEAFT